MSTVGVATEGYTVENATLFQWNSVSGDLLPERVDLLKKYVIGKNVLDAGCGGGGFVDYLVGEGFQATGVDKHDIFLQVSRQRGGSLTPRLPS